MSSRSSVTVPFDDLVFRWTWRPYQQRILDAVGEHLHDRRLHIVAAPGAGKTVLGIEIVRLLRCPALVLSPTLTIRDQWIARLRDFLPDASQDPPGWVGTDLERLSGFTSATYQALLARHRKRSGNIEEEPAGSEIDQESVGGDAPASREVQGLAERMRAAGVGTLVLDEVHHLRNEWWKALAALRDELPDLHLVALTATPPYDAAGKEWSRYLELCGPVDESVAAPEIVKTGTLCPHQDYVRAVEPGPEEVADLRTHFQAVRATIDRLEGDPVLHRAVTGHRWLAEPAVHEESIFDDPEQAFALLVYRAARGESLPGVLLDLLDVRSDELPAPDPRWWTTLVERYLFDDAGPVGESGPNTEPARWPAAEEFDAHRETWKRDLRGLGLLWRRTVRLDAPGHLQGLLAQSPKKIDACVAVCNLERDVRGDDLRQAVLTDFIRDETLRGAEDTPDTVPHLGAWPVFRALTRARGNRGRSDLALITGRLTLVHREIFEKLQPLLGSDSDRISIERVAGEDDLVQVTSPSANRLIPHLTALFDEGVIRVIVGTRALLGEGWDAPALNSLVLASYVGSFVLTNQMRGRALRTHRAFPDKQASIWHLVAVEPGSVEDQPGCVDLASLRERFKTFVGVSADGARIESGLERLDLPRPGVPKWHAAVNQAMEQRLRGSAGLAAVWRTALGEGEAGRVAPSVDIARPPSYPRHAIVQTLRHLFVVGAATFASVSSLALEWMPVVRDSGLLRVWMAVAFGLAGLAALPSLVRALKLLFTTLPIDGSARHAAEALLEALTSVGVIRTPPDKLAVRSLTRRDERIELDLQGGTYFEQSLFADALAELFGPIRNPRYLLTREGAFFGRRRDYHAVPTILGARKEHAAALYSAWTRHLGRCRLVYTRRREGRRILVQARARSFSHGFRTRSERVDRWC